MNSDSELCQAFIARMKSALSSRPDIQHSWSVDDVGDRCILSITGSGPTGFNIVAEVHPDEVTLSAQGWHDHYPMTGTLDDFVGEMSGRIRDMLSPAMRIREELSFGVAFRWHLENLTEGRWWSESTCGLLFYPWFGRKSEKIYSNGLLPAREGHVEGQAAGGSGR